MTKNDLKYLLIIVIFAALPVPALVFLPVALGVVVTCFCVWAILIANRDRIAVNRKNVGLTPSAIVMRDGAVIRGIRGEVNWMHEYYLDHPKKAKQFATGSSGDQLFQFKVSAIEKVVPETEYETADDLKNQPDVAMLS